MDAARVLTGHEQSLDPGAAGRVGHHAAHHEVRRGLDLDGAAREIAPEVAAAAHHAAERALDVLGAEVRDVDPHAAVRGTPPLVDLHERGARDEIAGGALHAGGIVALHEPLAPPVEQVAACPAQPFLEQRAGHERAGDDETGGMELHHLHVAQLEPGPIRERDPVRRFVGRARHDLVHGGPTAHREQGGARGDRRQGAVTDGEHESARGPALGVAQQLEGAALLEHGHVGARLHLLAEPVHDLDAGEIALVDGAVVTLAGERLLVDAPLGRPIEEAAVARLQLQHAARGLAAQRPHHLLIVDPSPALQRVGEVGVQRIGGGEYRVVAALDHARAARAAEQALDDHGHAERGRSVSGVQRGAEPGPAGAEDQDVGVETLDHDPTSRVSRARPCSEVHALLPRALPTSLPSRDSRKTVGVAVTS